MHALFVCFFDIVVATMVVKSDGRRRPMEKRLSQYQSIHPSIDRLGLRFGLCVLAQAAAAEAASSSSSSSVSRIGPTRTRAFCCRAWMDA
jgi:hypothetical protein